MIASLPLSPPSRASSFHMHLVRSEKHSNSTQLAEILTHPTLFLLQMNIRHVPRRVKKRKKRKERERQKNKKRSSPELPIIAQHCFNNSRLVFNCVHMHAQRQPVQRGKASFLV